MGGSGLAPPLAARSALPRSADRLLGLAMRARWSSTCKLASPSPTLPVATVRRLCTKEDEKNTNLATNLPRGTKSVAFRGGSVVGCHDTQTEAVEATRHFLRENELRRWVGRSGGSMTTTQ